MVEPIVRTLARAGRFGYHVNENPSTVSFFCPVGIIGKVLVLQAVFTAEYC
jgi:hypothetical protein